MVRPGGGTSPASRHAAIAFNEAINRRDLQGLRELMTDDHRLIDSDGNLIRGKEEVLEAWRGFFDAFPDYRNDWSGTIEVGDRQIAVGRSTCSNEPALDGPAIWAARSSQGKVAEWRVFEDTPANRSMLGI
jgi:ketosteroid isomerase-like protein